jgi:hypothetical protein
VCGELYEVYAKQVGRPGQLLLCMSPCQTAANSSTHSDELIRASRLGRDLDLAIKWRTEASTYRPDPTSNQRHML